MEVVVSESPTTGRTRALILVSRCFEDEHILSTITKAIDETGVCFKVTLPEEDQHIVQEFCLGGPEDGECEEEET